MTSPFRYGKEPAVSPAPETTLDLARQLLAEHGRDGASFYLKRQREYIEREYQLALAQLIHRSGEQSPTGQQLTKKFPSELSRSAETAGRTK